MNLNNLRFTRTDGTPLTPYETAGFSAVAIRTCQTTIGKHAQRMDEETMASVKAALEYHNQARTRLLDLINAHLPDGVECLIDAPF